jgi:cysteinyl-tRNA synthetase
LDARVVLLALAAACASARDGPRAPPESWAIQLQGTLRATDVEWLVVDPSMGRPAGPRTVLAYLNVGQAEEYRSYWRATWRAPEGEGRGDPDFLLALDPDGWPGNYPVAYWDPRWRLLVVAELERIVQAGFDGIYCDWVLGYREPAVVEAARAAGVDPARAMAELLRDLRAYARTKRPGFLVVAQNAAFLPEAVPEVYRWVDAVAQEDVSFRGEATSVWDDPRAGDVATPPGDREAIAAALGKWRARGVPVLTLDYAADPENAAAAREFARSRGFVPFVSRTPLDRMP